MHEEEALQGDEFSAGGVDGNLDTECPFINRLTLSLSAWIHALYTRLRSHRISLYTELVLVIERVHVNVTTPAGLETGFDVTLPSVSSALLNIDVHDIRIE